MWQLALGASLICAATDVHIESLDGSVAVGQLLGASADQLQLTVGERKLTLPYDELLYVLPQGAAPSPAKKPAVWIELRDGSRVQASEFVAPQRRATISLTTGHALEVDTSAVRSVRMNSPDPGTDTQWNEILQRKAEGDVVVIRKNNNSLDFLEGVLAAVGEMEVKFTFQGDSYDVSRDGMEGLIYFRPSNGSVSPPLCQLLDVDGNLWNVKSIAMAEGSGTWSLETLSGAKVSLGLDQVRKIDFSGGNLVYLSDVEPESVQWTPFFPTRVAAEELSKMYWLRRDQSFDGGKLRLRFAGDSSGTREFDKGLALHSRMRLVYLLPSGFRRLTAMAGIDDRAGESGHVRLSISGDGSPLLDVDVVGGGDPLPIDLDVSGVRRLRILVDFGDDLAIADQLDLCSARITK